MNNLNPLNNLPIQAHILSHGLAKSLGKKKYIEKYPQMILISHTELPILEEKLQFAPKIKMLS